MDSKIILLVFFSSLYLTMIQGAIYTPPKDQFGNINVSHAYGIADDFYAETKPFVKILDKYYYIEKERKSETNWFAALHKCRELGGDLVHFQNNKELDAVLSKLNKKKCYWIDLTNFAERHSFRSISTGNPGKVVRWGKVEPNNLGGNEHCAQLVAYDRRTFKMNDNKCHNVCSFICETNLPIQTNIVVW